MKVHIFSLAVCMFGLWGALSAAAQEKPAVVPQSSKTVQKLHWMAGHWVQKQGDMIFEEIWSEPEGDSMMCAFRVVKAGKPMLYELCAIEQTPAGPTLRLRHFNSGLIGWEEKDKPLNWPLVKLEPHLAVFECIEHGNKLRLSYHQTAPNRLKAILEKTNPEGKTETEEFTYSRKKPGVSR
ncbi:MAG: hypothetical protein K1Y36_18160 [Blastocatellia bacterium]|nr:hypothetical protein [Blastocatellia bacterium]